MKTKRLYVAIMLLMEVAVMGAQKLTVETMELAGMDISASSERRIDAKGKPCALVKVQLAAEGATFEGNVVQPADFRKGEYWVYMTDGSSLLTIKHPKYPSLTVNFLDYAIDRVRSLSTYTLVINLPASNASLDDGKRFFSIYVSQANPKVYVDDKLQQLNEGRVNVLLSRGKHTYRVEHVGYVTETGTVEIGDENVERNFSLQKAKVNVTIDCATPGAKIYIARQEKGTVPWTTQLEVGTSWLEARLDGYRPQEQTIELTEKDNNKKIMIPALQPIEGSIRVEFAPAGAEVYIDGKRLGKTPGVFQHQLIGNHTVEVRCRGYLTEVNDVIVSEGNTFILKGSMLKEGTADMSASQMVKLGDDYYHGTNGKKTDFAEAVKWYRKAAELGNANGQCLLGTMLDYGLGVEKDPVEAVKWYRKAAEQGHRDGQYYMGQSYEIGYGRGLTPDANQALYWYKKAAEQGHEGALQRISNMQRRRR